MTSRELVVKTLNHEPVPRVPRDLWIPADEDFLRVDELAEINVRYPSDILTVEVAPSGGKRSRAKSAEAGKTASYKPPAQLLNRARFAKANKVCQVTSRFVLAWSDVRPFNRLRFLHGGEAALVELAREADQTHSLLAALHEAACKELELWAKTDVDGVAFRDDWATPDGLLISPEMWRELFRPLYRDYCKILHAHDKFVFFRGEGNIFDIFGDLLKVGVDAIHCQWHLMNFERLAKRYRGRVTFWGEMDRRRLQNPDTADEFRQVVLAVRRALDFGHGGVVAQCPWDHGVRLQTIIAFFEHWLAPLPISAS